MRAFLVACLLAGCYQPSTESCYYQCAAGANPCPSGLECAGGMCVTPGDTCSGMGIDAVVPDGVEFDAPPPACGNGIPARGEICYGTPETFSPTTAPFDGVLADRDGDGDLDLIYMVEGTSGGFRQHVQGPSGLPTQGFAAPIVPNVQAMRAMNLDAMGSSEFITIDDAEISTLTWGAAGGALGEVSNYPRSGTVLQALFGNVTVNPRPNLVLINNAVAEVFAFDPSLRLTLQATTPVLAAGNINDAALGRLDGDIHADLVIAGNNGIGTMRAEPTGQFTDFQPIAVTNTPIAVEVGDVDGDMNLDIVFISVNFTQPAAGELGILHGMGNGTFAPVVTHPVPGIVSGLEVRDIDNDNRADIIAVRGGSQRALVFSLGRSNRQFEAPVFIPLMGMSAVLSVRGSYNGDIVPDIVVTDPVGGRVYVYPSNP